MLIHSLTVRVTTRRDPRPASPRTFEPRTANRVRDRHLAVRHPVATSPLIRRAGGLECDEERGRSLEAGAHFEVRSSKVGVVDAGRDYHDAELPDLLVLVLSAVAAREGLRSPRRVDVCLNLRRSAREADPTYVGELTKHCWSLADLEVCIQTDRDER